MCLSIKVLASLQAILEFFLTFPKKWVGRAMGNEALNWDDLILSKKIPHDTLNFYTAGS